MSEKKEVEIERVFLPELETVFPSGKHRVSKTFIAAVPPDELGNSKNKEENPAMGENPSTGEIPETGECQREIENIKLMKTEDLKVSEPFSSLFPYSQFISSSFNCRSETFNIYFPFELHDYVNTKKQTMSLQTISGNISLAFFGSLVMKIRNQQSGYTIYKRIYGFDPIYSLFIFPFLVLYPVGAFLDE